MKTTILSLILVMISAFGWSEQVLARNDVSISGWECFEGARGKVCCTTVGGKQVCKQYALKPIAMAITCDHYPDKGYSVCCNSSGCWKNYHL